MDSTGTGRGSTAVGVQCDGGDGVTIADIRAIFGAAYDTPIVRDCHADADALNMTLVSLHIGYA